MADELNIEQELDTDIVYRTLIDSMFSSSAMVYFLSVF